VIIHTFYKREI